MVGGSGKNGRLLAGSGGAPSEESVDAGDGAVVDVDADDPPASGDGAGDAVSYEHGTPRTSHRWQLFVELEWSTSQRVLCFRQLAHATALDRFAGGIGTCWPDVARIE